MAEEEGEKKGDLIGVSEAIPIYLIAGLFDIFSIFPLPIAAVVGQFIMTVIWIFHGVYPWGKKTWVWYLATWVVEFIPIASFFPMFIVGATRILAITNLTREAQKLGIDAKNEKVKQMVRIAKGKLMKDQIRGMQAKAIQQAGRRKDGSYDREAKVNKARAIQSKGADLDKSLERSPRKSGGAAQSAGGGRSVDGVAPPEETA